MFAKESEMVAAAASWMKASGMFVKSEFTTPWGICDLVGLKFNSRNVAHRLHLNQTGAIGSITRAVLLLQIPDVESKRSVSLGMLVRRCAPSIPEDVVVGEVDRLVADHFVIPPRCGRLQKVNGWMPLQKRLIAVELKLARIEEAMQQAINNLGFAEESYVGLPVEVAHRVAANQTRWSNYFNAGGGLLSVGPRGCKVLVRAGKAAHWADKAIQLYCVEKFWRTRLKGN